MRPWLVLLVAVVLVGCRSGSTPSGTGNSKSGSPPTTGPGLVGTWQLAPDPAKKDDPGAEFAAMLGGLFDFEFTSNETFELSMLGLLAEGKVQRTGNEVTLTVERVGGMTPEEAKKNKIGGEDEPLVFKGEISADGTTMTLWTDKPEEKSVFKKLVDEVGSPDVTEEERAMVGKWVVDDIKYEEPLKTAEERAQDYSIRHARLDLREDGKFRFRIGIRVDGSWSREGDKIALAADHVGGEPSKGEEPDVVEGTILPDGRIEIVAPDGKSKMFLKRG